MLTRRAHHAHHLHLLLLPRLAPERWGGPSAADLALVVTLLAIGLVPLAGLLAGARVGPGEAGAGTALALIAGREAWATARALRRRA